MSANSAPGFRTHPNHRIETKPADARVQVTFDGEVVADSDDVVILTEGRYDPVYYFPRRDVRMERLNRTNHRTHCPFKGDASYFTLTGGRTEENAVWSYEDPYDEMQVLKERLAFYPDKVDSITTVPGPPH